MLPWALRRGMHHHLRPLLSHPRPSTTAAAYSSLLTRTNREENGSDEDTAGDVPYVDVPRPGRKWERKPYPTPMKVLVRRAKEERLARRENPCRVLDCPPENGLLVPELVGVARRVYLAHQSLLRGTSVLLDRNADALTVHRCRFCKEVHVGKQTHRIRTCEGSKGAGSRNAAHVWRRGGIRDVIYFPKSYHLFDRVLNPRVAHKERLMVPKDVPAVVELCIQAGVDLPRYPVKRRTNPVYSIDGRIVDFEPDNDDADDEDSSSIIINDSNDSSTMATTTSECDDSLQQLTMAELGTDILRAWIEMRAGARELMGKYKVWTCGYCPEVQVGPRGHKVRMCKATGHQYRDGLHAWQEATVDDLIPPNYVWHVRDPHGPPLDNELRRYYGKAPAVVELCVQAGAGVPQEYWSMMRLDVVAPDRDEFDLVA